MSGTNEIMSSRSVMVISLRQPWAEFLVSGLMTIGSYKKTTSFTGVMIIHASHHFDNTWMFNSNFIAEQGNAHLNKRIVSSKGLNHLDAGSFIGAVILTGADDCYDSKWCISGRYYHRYIEAMRFISKTDGKAVLGVTLPPRGLQSNFIHKDSKRYRGLLTLSKNLGYKTEMPL